MRPFKKIKVNPPEFDEKWCYENCCAGRHKNCASIGGECKNKKRNVN